MPVQKFVVFDQDVFAGGIGSLSVPVPAGLEADAVIPGVETTVFDPHPITAFRVAAVIVAAVAGERHAVHNHASAQDRVELPHGTVFQGHIPQQHPFAVKKLYEIRPKIMARPETALFNGHCLHVHLAQGQAVRLLQVDAIG